MASTYSVPSLDGLVSSKRRLHRPPLSMARPKSTQMARAWPMCRYPLGSGGKRVCTRPPWRPASRSASMISWMKVLRSGSSSVTTTSSSPTVASPRRAGRPAPRPRRKRALQGAMRELPSPPAELLPVGPRRRRRPGLSPPGRRSRRSRRPRRRNPPGAQGAHGIIFRLEAMSLSLLFQEGAVVLFQGDSITDCGRDRRSGDHLGWGYAMMAASWFSALYPERRVTFLNRGVSGDRTKDLVARWEEDCIALKPDWVSILIGINDTWRRYDSGDPTPLEEFERNYRRLLTEVKERLGAGLI